MDITFTAHNFRLDDETFTKAEMSILMEQHPWFLSAKRILPLVFPSDKSKFTVADLGYLEGCYTVEFAIMGRQVMGLEVRDANIATCHYVKDRTNLSNLEFIQDDAWNIAKFGTFDAVFCCGLLYHLDEPKRFLHLLSRVTQKLLIVQTNFATERLESTHSLSPDIVENEGNFGRWYVEYPAGKLSSTEMTTGVHRGIIVNLFGYK